MAAIVTFYNDFFETRSDPRVKSWNLMDGPMPTLFVIAVYLLSVLVILPAYMKNRKPYNLKTIIRYYDVFQILSCFALIYYLVTAGWWQGRYSYTCQPIDYSDDPLAVRMVEGFYWTHILKMIELIETVFFVLRKKFNQVSGLHVYHHVSTYMLTWIGCKFVGGGMASVPIIVNSFIHILMYTYYYLVSFGPKWQKRLAPWKPKLTLMQMMQFLLLILHSLTALKPSCDVPKGFLLLYLPNVVLICKMFGDFYRESYIEKNKKTRNTHKEQQKSKAT